jgi:integrase/recombinase XerD
MALQQQPVVTCVLDQPSAGFYDGQRILRSHPIQMSRKDVWYMVRRRAADAGIETAIGCHTFRATGITDYLTNGGRIEVAQRMAGHSNAKTTGLYDRRNDDVSVGEVERIGI